MIKVKPQSTLHELALAYAANIAEVAQPFEIEIKLRFLPVVKGYEHTQKCQILFKLNEQWFNHSVIDTSFIYNPILGLDKGGNLDPYNIRGFQSPRTFLKYSEFSPL
jgi:hypothetical protein